MSVPNRQVEFEGVKGIVSGVHVLFAAKGGVIEAVDIQSIQDGLGLSRNDRLWTYLLSNRFVGMVAIDGLSHPTNLVSLESFFKFCMLNPSPQLNAFRDDLARAARSIQARGSYIDPDAGPGAFIPAGFESNPTVRMLATLMDHEVRMERLGGEVRELREEIEDVRERNGRGPSHWTVAAWIAHHGFSATVDVMKDEGGFLRRICRDRGIAFPEEKVCNGGSFPARMWPIEAIRIWWPECCQRHGWGIHWKV